MVVKPTDCEKKRQNEQRKRMRAREQQLLQHVANLFVLKQVNVHFMIIVTLIVSSPAAVTAKFDNSPY